jgi:hypothetical protein
MLSLLKSRKIKSVAKQHAQSPPKHRASIACNHDDDGWPTCAKAKGRNGVKG